MEYGREPGEASGGATYVPITKIPTRKVNRQAAEERCEVADIVEGYAEDFAGVLYSGNRDSRKQMVFAIREIMRNVIEHSDAQTIWYAGQAWPSKDILEIAVLDDGIGIQESLETNIHYKELAQTDKDAINFSLMPGVTRTFSPSRLKKRDEDVYINTGFGLYMTSNICKEFGSFCITSGDTSLFKSGEDIRMWETAYRGTAIRMRLKISKLGEIAKLRSQLVRSGERDAKTNAKAIATASKASKLTSLRERS